MSVYYNECDPHACQWLRNLIRAGAIPEGDVDERPIQQVRAEDVVGYSQRHWFAGVGGWALALRLAGWPDERPCDTGSCPCQPFSAAGKGEAQEDERHLWPEFFRIIRKCRPPVIIGEQVEGAIGYGWLDGVFLDLERCDYACGAAVLPAACCGAPHIRHRIFWAGSLQQPGERGDPCWLGSPSQQGLARRQSEPGDDGQKQSATQRAGDATGGVPDTQEFRRRQGDSHSGRGAKRKRAKGSGCGSGNGGEPDDLANHNGERCSQRRKPDGEPERSEQSAPRRSDASGRGADVGELGDTDQCGVPRFGRGSSAPQNGGQRQGFGDGCGGNESEFAGADAGGISDTAGAIWRPQRDEDRGGQGGGYSPPGCDAETHSGWSDFHIVYCTDGKFRRVPTQPEFQPLASRIPRDVGPLLAVLGAMGHDSEAARRIIREARRNAGIRLKGYGNSIIPQVAAEFIRAFVETGY